MNIVSEQDLSPMGICCSNIKKMPFTMEIPNNGAPLSELQEIQQTHGQANSRHQALSSFLTKLMDDITQRIKETDNNPSLHEHNNPWLNLFNEWSQYYAMFQEMENRSAKEFLREFSAEGYQAKAKFINECVEKFNTLDREHQIAKLRVHVETQGQGNM